MDELQDTISKDRKVNKLWQKLFNIRLNLKTRLKRQACNNKLNVLGQA